MHSTPSIQHSYRRENGYYFYGHTIERNGWLIIGLDWSKTGMEIGRSRVILRRGKVTKKPENWTVVRSLRWGIWVFSRGHCFLIF